MEVNSQPDVPARILRGHNHRYQWNRRLCGRRSQYGLLENKYIACLDMDPLPDRLARKLAPKLNRLFRFCPLFNTYQTSACTYTDCFYIVLLQRTAKRLECQVYSNAKVSLLKKFN